MVGVFIYLEKCSLFFLDPIHSFESTFKINILFPVLLWGLCFLKLVTTSILIYYSVVE